MNRRDILSAFAAAVAIPAETASPVTLKDHLQALEAAMRADPELAWAWRIDFNKQVSWLGMEPEQAVELAQMLIKHARAISKSPVSVVLH